jgi:hypothetical protein
LATTLYVHASGLFKSFPGRLTEVSDFKFTLERTHNTPVSTDELLSDIRRVAAQLGRNVVSMKLYAQNGRYDPGTVARRFGTWNKAMLAVELKKANEINISDERLFENLMVLWEHYGRQPRRAELAKIPSRVSQTPYNRRFGSWSAALMEFVAFANANELPSRPATSITRSGHSTSRDPSLRLRFNVLKRDNFCCRACGASPALQPGISLHVDHIKPWSRGGETLIENLQTLCEVCNLGKSNSL